MDSTTLSPQSLVNKFFIARVADNADPQHLFRVRISVESLLDADDHAIADLPWALPGNLMSQGSASGNFWIPEIDDLLYVTFQGGDLAFPMYFGGVRKSSTGATKVETNYPNRWGVQDSAGNWFFVDKKSGETEWHHESGTQMRVDKAGNMNWLVVGDLVIQSDKSVSLMAQTTLSLNGQSIEIQSQSPVNVNTDLVAAGKSVGQHQHGGVTGGTSTTSIPI